MEKLPALQEIISALESLVSAEEKFADTVRRRSGVFDALLAEQFQELTTLAKNRYEGAKGLLVDLRQLEERLQIFKD